MCVPAVVRATPVPRQFRVHGPADVGGFAARERYRRHLGVAPQSLVEKQSPDIPSSCSPACGREQGSHVHRRVQARPSLLPRLGRIHCVHSRFSLPSTAPRTWLSAAGERYRPLGDPGTIRFLRLIAAFRFRSCRVAQLGQVHIRSRFGFRFTVPHTLQVLLLGNHMGARMTSVWRHCPL